MTATQLILGKTYKIQEFVHSPLSINFLEIGLLPGKRIKLVQRAPFGGPIAFLLEDHLVALRHSEAELLIVEAEK